MLERNIFFKRDKRVKEKIIDYTIVYFNLKNGRVLNYRERFCRFLINHFWKISTVTLILVSIFLYKYSVYFYENEKELRNVVNEQSLLIEEITYHNAKMIELNNSPNDVVEIASVMQEILNTSDGDKRKFLEKVLPHAIRMQIQYNIPASALISMAIYESNYGKSSLADVHNYFGMKAFGRWKGEKVYKKTKDYNKTVIHVQPFRSYETVYDGFYGFYEFLKTSGNGKRYKNAFTKTKGVEFVSECLRSGYCPDSFYLEHIKKIISRHKLELLENIIKESQNMEIKPFIDGDNKTVSVTFSVDSSIYKRWRQLMEKQNEADLEVANTN